MTVLNIPSEWNVGDVLGAADMNSYVRDNAIIIDSAISLTNTGYGCSLATATSQNITKETWTALEFAAEVFDDDTMHDNATNNSRITIKEAGRYKVDGQLLFDGLNSAGIRLCAIYKNGAIEAYGGSKNAGGASNVDSIIVSCVLDLDTDDYIELYTQHTSTTSPLTVTTRRFSAYRLKNDGT